MKIGVKEFSERFDALAEGSEPVVVTKDGRVVGTYQPAPPLRTRAEKVRDWAAAEERLEQFRTEWRANTPDWKERLASIGLDPEGDPLPECD